MLIYYHLFNFFISKASGFDKENDNVGYHIFFVIQGIINIPKYKCEFFNIYINLFLKIFKAILPSLGSLHV